MIRMRRKIVLAITLMFLTGLLTYRFQIARAMPKTIYVDDDNITGPWDGTREHPFQNISSALKYASSSDIIYVHNGTYYEHLIIDKTVSLIGENRSTTIVDGSTTGTVVNICTNSVRMDGFTVQNGYYGIYLNSSKSTIIRNTIKSNFFGIYSSYSNDNNLSESVIESNYYGIYLWASSRNIICENTLNDNDHGIDLWENSNNIITKNVAKDNGAYGIYAYHSHTNTISENTFNNSGYGIVLDRSNGNEVVLNVVANNADGVFVYDSRNNLVRGNMITAHHRWLMGRGMLIGGYLISEHYYNNTICDNIIRNNRFGIQLYQYANYNWIYHNSFINNQIQANIDEFTSNNTWDNGYPSGGNYWDDYNGTDLCSGPYQNETGYDWIGDSQYTIDQNNRDKYPLMYPFVPEMEEIRIAYRNLLFKYAELHSDFDSLNSTLYKLLDNITNLQENYDSLSTTITNLQEQINSLNSTLQTSIRELQEKYNSLINQTNSILNVMYIFITTTAILIITTVYFARRKPRAKQQ